MITIDKLYLLATAGAVFAIAHLLADAFAPGARNVPGPLLAKITNLYRFFNVSRGSNQTSLIELHRKYGDNVRIGPRVISIRNPQDVNKVYNVKRGYAKSKFYAVQQQLVNGVAKETLFTTLNESFHARIKRPIANAYSMTTLTDYEPLVDKTIGVLFSQLDQRYSSTGAQCPIFEWLQFYAFDVIGELTCSMSFGFVKEGRDVGGTIDGLNKTMDYNAVIGQLPWLDYWLKKNPIWTRLTRPVGAVAQFARQRLDERLSGEDTGTSNAPGSTIDFVDRFFKAKQLYPNVVDDGQILSYMITNMFAGSDTTAISLRAIIYYTLKAPDIYDKLMSELDDAHTSGRLSVPAKWRESQQLPFFNAVVLEALRLHPAVGLILERVVPDEGLELTGGPILPPGTIVGASPWVMHRDKSIFGEDVDDFKPERWLQKGNESRETFEKRLQAMNGATFTFGKGHRTCIGKNISLLEIKKLLPSLFLTYDMSLVHPNDDWKIHNAWFVRQEGVQICIQRRK